MEAQDFLSVAPEKEYLMRTREVEIDTLLGGP
jgi:hypothetical protein